MLISTVLVGIVTESHSASGSLRGSIIPCLSPPGNELAEPPQAERSESMPGTCVSSERGAGERNGSLNNSKAWSEDCWIVVCIVLRPKVGRPPGGLRIQLVIPQDHGKMDPISLIGYP